MSLTPLSFDTMKQLKVRKDDNIRQQRISEIVTKIYRSAKELAETTTQTSYSYNAYLNVSGYCRRPKSEICSASIYEFHIINMQTILTSLRNLFPGCVVQHSDKLVHLSSDGKHYEVDKPERPENDYNSNYRWLLIKIDWS
jgi:hypothetical protein